MFHHGSVELEVWIETELTQSTSIFGTLVLNFLIQGFELELIIETKLLLRTEILSSILNSNK